MWRKFSPPESTVTCLVTVFDHRTGCGRATIKTLASKARHDTQARA